MEGHPPRHGGTQGESQEARSLEPLDEFEVTVADATSYRVDPCPLTCPVVVDRHYKEGLPLSNLEYALIAEILGRAFYIAPQATNSSAP
jgi:hypothetical protein